VLLDIVDLMINHGGLNSIYECVHKLVPIICIPLNKKWDLQGNSARVRYFNIGDVIQPNELSKSTLLHCVNRILKGTMYRDNIAQMRERFMFEMCMSNTAIKNVIPELTSSG
jgi:UDP:flavonoid glycosyltransferase YjiC (YdhE family)